MAEFKLDAKTRKAMLGIMPFTQKGDIDYIPPVANLEEIPPDMRPKYKLRAFNHSEMKKARDILGKPKRINTDDVADMVRACIKGWQNVFDLANGESIDYKEDAQGGVDKELFKNFPDSMVTMIFKELMLISGLLEVEKQGLES